MVIVGELKLSFSLYLVLQAVDRTAACDDVWLAVGAAARGRLRIPVCASSVVFSVSAYSEYHPVALSKYWSSPSLGGPAGTADAVTGWLMNIVCASETLLWVDRRDSRS